MVCNFDQLIFFSVQTDDLFFVTIASQDVAQDRALLETYDITHILNLAPGVDNMFEDELNYKKIEILDLPETNILQYVDECYDFISEGVQRGNVLVHCNAGVSRSTAICCAFLMKKQKIKYKEALALVSSSCPFVHFRWIIYYFNHPRYEKRELSLVLMTGLLNNWTIIVINCLDSRLHQTRSKMHLQLARKRKEKPRRMLYSVRIH